MPRIQVADAKPFAGVGKESKRPYNALKVVAIVHMEDGTVEAGTFTFFEGPNNPLPRVSKGQVYEPVIGFESRDGNLQPRVVGFTALASASVPKAA